MAEDKKTGRLLSILRRGGQLLFILVFIALHCMIVINAVRLSKDVIRGDGSAISLTPAPQYGCMRVPDGPLARDVDAVNRLSGDFAQIYFPAKRHASWSEAYSKQSPDPWHRPSRYAPLMHVLCSISLCHLSYGPASFLNMAIQLLLFYLSFVFAFKTLHLEKYLLPGILLVNVCLFLTPVGLSWFERGQFSLYVALGYLWLLLGMISGKPAYMVVSAFFAYMKLTSFPFVFVGLALWMLNSRSVLELKRSLLFAAVFLIAIALFFLPFLKSGIPFLAGLMEQELSFAPQALSVARLLPRSLVKALPFILVVLGYVQIKVHRHDFALLIPFFVGCGIILITYPTLAYDYSVPTLLGFIPLVLYWSKLPTLRHRLYGHAVTLLFCAFLVIASFSSPIAKHFHSDIVMIWLYLLSASLFLLLSLYCPKCREPRKETE